MSLDVFLQQVCNGITLGSVYALVAIGYTMVYGIMRLINFAHGSLFMMSMYFAFYAIGFFVVPWYIAFPLVAVLTAVMGMATERIAYYPLRRSGSPPTSILISAVGVSYFIENFATVLFTGRQKLFPSIPFFTDIITLGNVRLQRMSIVVPILTFVLLVILMFLLEKSKPGMAMRAVSRDADAAQLMGIDVNRTISLTFGIGSALAAVGAMVWGLKYPQIAPTIGAMPGMKCFVSAVIGGIGNVKGAVIGGLLLGFVEVMIVAFFPALTSYRDAFAFCFLIVVLLVKPTGIIGEKIADKV